MPTITAVRLPIACDLNSARHKLAFADQPPLPTLAAARPCSPLDGVQVHGGVPCDRQVDWRRRDPVSRR
ncbi:hypothetical protein [Streptomyces noursei]|uniref:hypothetical protein n=1 Tax=Streptomyces noursei TaxID=1971 RepID=UPI0013924022|nr:hypothetical protein [Streptomyces noursei]